MQVELDTAKANLARKSEWLRNLALMTSVLNAWGLIIVPRGPLDRNIAVAITRYVTSFSVCSTVQAHQHKMEGHINDVRKSLTLQ